MSTSATINEDKLNAFLGKVVGDFGAALSADLVYIGQRLGLYQVMAKLGPLTPTELAKKTETQERYIREWLINQADGRLDSGPHGDGGEAEGRRQGGRRRLRPRSLHDHHGQGLPERQILRVRYPRPVHRACQEGGEGGGGGRPDHLLGSERASLPRRELRSDCLLRLPSRHGRPGRGDETGGRGARKGRQRSDRRADGRRRGRGQLQPDRPDLLRRLDPVLHRQLPCPEWTGSGRRRHGAGTSGAGRGG